MNSCPNCHNELQGQSDTCANCGFQLTPSTSESGKSVSDAEGLEIVVTEAHDTSPELIGGISAPKPSDDLGLQSNAELVQLDSTDNLASVAQPNRRVPEQIGESQPPPPPGNADLDTTARSVPIMPSVEKVSSPPVKKLTAEQVKSIRQELYGDNPAFIDDQEKADILKKVNGDSDQPGSPGKGFDTAPIVPPTKEKTTPPSTPLSQTQPPAPKPKMADRSRGIAYFAKNLIQVTGEQDLYEGDELIINSRSYVLRKKKLNSKTLYMILAPIAAILLFWLGAHFTHDGSGGSGQIVGLVLGDDGQPVITGASIRIPELNRTLKSDSQGFFRSGQIDRGSYKIEYIVDKAVIGTDFATVVDGEVTMLTLKPTTDAPQVEAESASRPVATHQEPARTTSTTVAKVDPPAEPPKKSNPTPRKAPSTSPAKLKLAANVTNAKLALDGKVLGAGNLTFSKLEPGKHTWKVSADGFESKSGQITLEAGNTSKLVVNLERMQQVEKEKVYDYEQFYNSGIAALTKGQYAEAIADFNQALEREPSYADAHLARAEARERSRDQNGAHDDYLLAAEQYRLKNNYKKASTCYGRALSINGESTAALLGRASLYLSRGEEIAAIADYEAVKELDKRNVQAYLGLGEARFRQGLYKKAIKHFNDARSIDSSNPVPYQYLMLCHMARNDLDKVKDSYDRFVEVATDKEINKLHSNNKYTAVIRVVESY